MLKHLLLTISQWTCGRAMRRNGHRANALQLKQMLEVLQRYKCRRKNNGLQRGNWGRTVQLDRRAKYALETVFVDHGGYGCFAVLLQRANHSSGAIHEHVTVCPRTTAGRTMRKRMTVPTPRVVLVWKRTPPAEMSAVSAKYSWASAVRTVMGSLSGNR